MHILLDATSECYPEKYCHWLSSCLWLFKSNTALMHPLLVKINLSLFDHIWGWGAFFRHLFCISVIWFYLGFSCHRMRLGVVSVLISSILTWSQHVIQAVKLGRQQFSANYHLIFRLFKACLFLGVLATIISLSGICQLSLMDLLVCCLAFLPTGWGLILVIKFLSLSLSLFLLRISYWYLGLFRLHKLWGPRYRILDCGSWRGCLLKLMTMEWVQFFLHP